MNLEEAIAMVITDESIADLQLELDKEKEEQQDTNLMIIQAEQDKKNEEG